MQNGHLWPLKTPGVSTAPLHGGSRQPSRSAEQNVRIGHNCSHPPQPFWRQRFKRLKHQTPKKARSEQTRGGDWFASPRVSSSPLFPSFPPASLVVDSPHIWTEKHTHAAMLIGTDQFANAFDDIRKRALNDGSSLLFLVAADCDALCAYQMLKVCACVFVCLCVCMSCVSGLG